MGLLKKLGDQIDRVLDALEPFSRIGVRGRDDPAPLVLLEDFMLYGPTLVRPQQKEVEVPQHKLQKGTRICLLEERPPAVVMETRQDVGGDEVRKGVFIVTSEVWASLCLRAMPAAERKEILDKYSRKKSP